MPTHSTQSKPSQSPEKGSSISRTSSAHHQQTSTPPTSITKRPQPSRYTPQPSPLDDARSPLQDRCSGSSLQHTSSRAILHLVECLTRALDLSGLKLQANHSMKVMGSDRHFSISNVEGVGKSTHISGCKIAQNR